MRADCCYVDAMSPQPRKAQPAPPPSPAPRRPLWRWLRTAIIVIVLILLVPYALVPLYRFVDPVSTLMLWRRAKGARVERTVVPLERIDPNLPRAVIAAEDGSFCTHHGVDLRQMREAVAKADGLQEARGGSTITQQLAKNLFLWQGRSFIRKGLEFPLALWINLVLPKRRQIEIYLNVVEWGPTGEFGAEAAARRAFGKSARQLTAQEAALLAATLPNPVRRNPRQPGPGLRRLTGIYMTRAASEKLDACIRSRTAQAPHHVSGG
jgi:monofunctional glycosyltransferase